MLRLQLLSYCAYIMRLQLLSFMHKREMNMSQLCLALIIFFYFSTSFSAMDSSSSEAIQDFSRLRKIYKDGRVDRLITCEFIPPSLDPTTNVDSKDMVIISKDENIYARIYLPKLNDPNQKLPLLVYFHGGGFVQETPFSSHYHKFLNTIVSQANVTAVSVHYRRAPEHPLPIAFEDSWFALKWVASHSGGNGPDEWLNRHADFGNVFFSGDSAGGTIAHHMGLQVGTEGLHLQGINLQGIVLLNPFFWGAERIGSEAEKPEIAAFMGNWWRFVCPSTTGSDDPMINPAKDSNLGRLACKRMLVFVAENDLLKDRGWYYKELLEKNDQWQGVVEVMESKGEGHVFHLFKPNSENAIFLFNQIVSFINHN